MSTPKRYLLGMLSGAGSVVIKTALNIVLIPVLIGKLGLDAFGLYILLIAIMEVSTLLDLGLTDALVTLLGGSEMASKDRASYLKVGQILFGLLAVLFLAAGFALLPYFSTLFHVNQELQTIAQTGFLLILLESVIMIISCYARSVLLAHCAHQWTNVGDTLYSVVASLGALIALMSGYDLIAVLAIRLLASVIRLFLMTVQTWKLEPSAFWPAVPFCFSTFKKVGHLCGHAMMINFSIIISHKIDDIVIASFLPLSAVGIYEIVFRFLGITIQICLKLHEGAFPLFSKMAAASQKNEARQLFLRMSSFLNFTAAMLLMLIVVNYPTLFDIFSAGKIPIEDTIPVLIIAIPCILSGVLQMPANAWLFTWGHQSYLTGTSIIAALANLALSIILVQHFGVALGTFIPQFIQHQFCLIRKTCAQLQISFLQYMRAVHTCLLLPLIVSLLWVKCWHPVIHHFSIPLVPIAFISLGAVLIGSGLWFWRTASPVENQLFRQVFVVKLLQPIQYKFKQQFNTDNA
jgi:O-antigen/teichoic acid export membrane protein